jgi:tetratricopeptide (TPR) repeat protein
MRAGVFVASGVCAVFGLAEAQPADPDVAEAAALYEAATAAMNDGRYADAARDYQAAYELTKDPILFFKIGSAHDKAGACDAAVPFYQRYLDEGKPEPQYVELTNDRIAKCAPLPAPAPAPTPAAPAPAPVVASKNKNAAWLLVGGALTFVTVGAVLAYSAESSEQDIRDLYVGFAGVPPMFDDDTRAEYDELIAQGERYERLSWASFGLAAGCAIGATIFFVRASKERVAVTPIVSPKEAGMAATVRF